MPVAYVTKISGTEEMYRRVAADTLAGGALPGLVLHAAGEAESGGRWIVEVWESAEAAERFARERLFPALERHGITEPPLQRETIAVDNLVGAVVAAA